MAKYKKVNEGILDKFIGSVFGAIGRGAHSRALKHLSKKDPDIAKQIKTIEKNRKELAKMLKQANVEKPTKADKAALAKGEYFTF